MKHGLFKNIGRGLMISIITLSSLSSVVYFEDAVAGNGNGNGGGNDAGNSTSGNASDNGRAQSSSAVAVDQDNATPGVSRESYEHWLSEFSRVNDVARVQAKEVSPVAEEELAVGVSQKAYGKWLSGLTED